jgi:hypothetical protein
MNATLPQCNQRAHGCSLCNESRQHVGKVYTYTPCTHRIENIKQDVRRWFAAHCAKADQGAAREMRQLYFMKLHSFLSLAALVASTQLAAGAVIMAGDWRVSKANNYAFEYVNQPGLDVIWEALWGVDYKGEECTEIYMLILGEDMVDDPLHASWLLVPSMATEDSHGESRPTYSWSWSATFTPDEEGGSWAGSYFVSTVDATVPEGGPGSVILGGLLCAAALRRRRP